MWFNFDSKDCWVVNFRVETANHPFVQGADDYLQTLEAVDAALIFEGQTQLDQVLVLTAACFPMGGFEPGISDCAYSKVSALVGNVSLLFGLGVELNWYKTILYQLGWPIAWETLVFTSTREREGNSLGNRRIHRNYYSPKGKSWTLLLRIVSMTPYITTLQS